MDLLGSKLVILALFGLVKFIAGLTPSIVLRLLKAHSKRQRLIEKVMGGVSCSGGGALLATVFIHMLPEARESINHAIRHFEKSNMTEDEDEHTLESHEDSHEEEHAYPYAELIMFVGFFAIYFIEAVVHIFFSGAHGSGFFGHSHGIFPDMIEDTIVNQEEKNISIDSGQTEQTKPGILKSENSNSNNGVDNNKFIIRNEGLASRDINEITPKATINKLRVSATGGTDVEVKITNEKDRKLLFSVRNLFMLLALSIHGIFEGMAIGLQTTSHDVCKLFVALSLHEIPVLFCVGMEMFNVGIKKLHIIAYFMSLGIVSSVGIIIGIVLTLHANEANSDTNNMIIGLLQGLAGGTLLYVTFYEVLDREKLSKAGMTGILGCTLTMIGFGLMAWLEAAGAHNHGWVDRGHDNHDSHDQHDH